MDTPERAIFPVDLVLDLRWNYEFDDWQIRGLSLIAEEVLDHSKLHTDDIMSQAQKESDMRFESLLMKIDQRFDEAKNRSKAVEKRTKTRLKAVEKRTKTRLKAVEKRINKQLKALEVQVSDDDSTLPNIEKTLSDLRNRLRLLPWTFAMVVLGLLATLATLFVNLQVIFG